MEKTFCKTDPDSYEAYYEPDHGDPNELVEVNDDVYTFTWNRGKSNDNLTDTGEGKGFSFYLARRAYYDRYRLIDQRLATDINNTGILGRVDTDPKLMIVINLEEDFSNDDNRIHIISAYYTDNPKLIKKYENHKRFIIKLDEASKKFYEDKEKVKRLRENIEKRQKYIEELQRNPFK